MGGGGGGGGGGAVFPSFSAGIMGSALLPLMYSVHEG